MWRKLFQTLFGRRVHHPIDWLITDAGRPLFELRYVRDGDNALWMEYSVTYLEGGKDLWEYATDRRTSPRQFKWMLEEIGGDLKRPLSEFMVLGTGYRHRALVKCLGPSDARDSEAAGTAGPTA